MDARAAKLALARKKLKDHQEKKQQDNTLHNAVKVGESIDQQYSQMPDYRQPIAISQQEKFEVTPDSNSVELIKPTDIALNNNTCDNDVNATEILIGNKRMLEQQINSLQTKQADLENLLTSTTQNYNDSCQKIVNLENILKNTYHENQTVIKELQLKNETIKKLSDLHSSLLNENSSLQEQLEFTKSILAGKEVENNSLQSQLLNVQTELDAKQLQLQQLTSGGQTHVAEDITNALKSDNELLMQKVSYLEQQLKIQIKDYQQVNSHYEHYVGELNNQLKEVMIKNEQLNREILDLSNREHSLIEQIGDMEIRLQNYKASEPIAQEQMNVADSPAFKEVQENYEKAQNNLQVLYSKYSDLEKLYAESRAEVESLTHSKELDSQEVSENVSLIKLNADITSDKIAAQRATEQNKKLKQDIHGLEDAFVKMTKDKLELTEKITAEKFLNRELTIKLAEIDEKATDMQKTLKAKDEEMIRLQTNYRIIEEKYHEIAEYLKNLNEIPVKQENIINYSDKNGNEEVDTAMETRPTECCRNSTSVELQNGNESTGVPKDNAMVKLQERFLKIMDEVADLSDEKHRLEHIITQLQNETDTICEYVALYQQQRSLLKKRDEERSAQMKMFQSECARLQSQLDELTGLLKRFAEDRELSAYFQVETKHKDIEKVMQLLSKLKTNSLIDPQKSIKFNDFYPCSCCSGQLIEV